MLVTPHDFDLTGKRFSNINNTEAIKKKKKKNLMNKKTAYKVLTALCPQKC